jgi:hypothetical protein
MRQLWRQFRLDWEQGLRRLPFFTQRAVVALLGVLVATLAGAAATTSTAGGRVAGTTSTTSATTPPHPTLLPPISLTLPLP